MEAVLRDIPAPPMREGALQMQVTSIDYNDYVGRIGVGRVYRGHWRERCFDAYSS